MTDHARELRRRLNDPTALIGALGLEHGARRQPRGMIICCPWHADVSPSCSVTVGNDGTIRVRCFSCGATGDALTLVAVAFGLDVQFQFRRVLEETARIVGYTLDTSLRGWRRSA